MGLVLLLAQCVCMFVASFLCGSLPLMFKSAMSGLRLKAISVLGMGLLVGAALTIIIPEGVSTLYDSLPNDGRDHEEATIRAVGLSLLSGFALMLLIESLTPHPPHSPPSSPSSTPPTIHTPLTAISPDRRSLESGRPSPHHLNSSSPMIPKRMHVSDVDESGRKNPHPQGGVQGLNATLGLVIHGAADGIALGASSLSGSGSLGLVVFLAVLVHKGPTALGLTTTLLGLSLSPPQIRRRLLIFSFAAPLGAILTYLLVRVFGGNSAGGQHDADGLGWWTGIALLFSGGSFLYVATVIQPLSAPSPHSHTHSHHTSADLGEENDPPLGKYLRTGMLVGGMIAPVILAALVGDHH
ncbi:Zinc/iron permease [Naematelia encephala]|uniref:Zinc/iron permease n=1 Tax=Naematelia encephala TaxID=71784 RepID=A0A1Y2BL97_9TREE|nr:Zinc/iron permease [Naematelia encephala]